MAIAFGSVASASNNGAAVALTVDVPYPTGITAGDILLLCGVNTCPAAYNTPTGWTLVQGPGPAAVNDCQAAVFSTVATGTESGTVTLTLVGTNTATAVGGAMLRYHGATSTLRGSGNVIPTSESTTSGAPPAVSGVVSTDMVIAFYFYGDGTQQAANVAQTFTTTNLTSGGWATRLNLGIGANATSQYDDGIVVADKLGQTAAGPTITVSNSGGWVVVTVALSAAAVVAANTSAFLPFFA